MVADAARSFDHPAADAKGESRLVFSLYLPGKHFRLAELTFFGDHGANRTRLRRFGLSFLLASGKQQRERRQQYQRPRQAASRLRRDRGKHQDVALS